MSDYKGNVIVKGRRSPFSKYEALVSFERGDYNQRDAFIKIFIKIKVNKFMGTSFAGS